MKILFYLEKTLKEPSHLLTQLVKWSFADGHEVHCAYDATYVIDTILQKLPITLHSMNQRTEAKEVVHNIEVSSLNNMPAYQNEQLSKIQFINRLGPDIVVCHLSSNLCKEQKLIQAPLIKIRIKNVEQRMETEKSVKTNIFANSYASMRQCLSNITNNLTTRNSPKAVNIMPSCHKLLEPSYQSQEFTADINNNDLLKEWLNLISLFVPRKNKLADTRRLNISNKRSSGVSTALQQFYEEREPHQKDTPKFHLSLATSTGDREAAYHLAYKIYREKAYVEVNSSEILTTPFDLVDDTMVLIVKHKSKVVGTLTLLCQKELPLPIEKVFEEEISQLKLAGEKIVEVSRLAIDSEYRNEKEVLRLLLNHVFICTYHVMQYTSLVIEVNPHHVKFYEMLLAFRKISDEKPCPHVQNAPAVLLHLYLSKYREKLKECEKIRKAEANTMKKDRSLYASFMSMDEEISAANNIREQFKGLTEEQKEYFNLHAYEVSTK